MSSDEQAQWIPFAPPVKLPDEAGSAIDRLRVKPSQSPVDYTDMREYLAAQRQALLMQVDAIERLLKIEPRTSELRKAGK